MARKNPLSKLKDTATGAVAGAVVETVKTVKDPIGTGQKVVGQAVGQAVAVAGAVTSRVGRKKASAPRVEHRPGPVAVPQDEPRKDQGDPLAPAVKKAVAKKTAKKAAKKAAKKTAKKTPAKKAAAKKSAKKAPAKKAAAKKTAAKKVPLSAEELVAGAGTEVITPVGTRGADTSINPDTTDHDLQQVDTEPLMDPSLTKSVRAEADTAARAADPDPDAKGE